MHDKVPDLDTKRKDVLPEYAKDAEDRTNGGLLVVAQAEIPLSHLIENNYNSIKKTFTSMIVKTGKVG